ncbi:CD209 antigen-like protein C [Argopecten irradians]|uniref:CD209 antigen-like protein C n=1 Tax=Argopecten irradians TaxID=31199 RepID=UPI00371F6CE1
MHLLVYLTRIYVLAVAHLVCGELILEKKNTMDNWFPLTSVTTVGLVRSPAECGLHCLRVGWCQAMIYDVIENVCNLSNRSSTVSESYWKPNTTYFQVKQTVPDGYKCDVFTRSCATVMDSLYSWADAIDKCSDDGARLLMIESAKKQLETEQFMENEGLIYAWLGLTDQTIEGRWTDPDGGQALYTYFNNGQPDNGIGSGQHCAMIKKHYGYRWDDEFCTSRQHVICEITTS